MEGRGAKMEGWRQELRESENGEGDRKGETQGQKEKGRDEERWEGGRMNGRMIEASSSYLMASSFSSNDSQGWRSSLNSRSSTKKERNHSKFESLQA